MDLLSMHQSIIDGLANIEGVNFVAEMPKRRNEVTLPAIFVDLGELEPAEDSGTGELGLYAHWEARVIISSQQNVADMWSLCAAVMVWLFVFTWPDINVGRPKLKQAAPDHFTPDLQGHRVWLIEWMQEIRVGENIWNGEGVIPDTLIVNACGEFDTEIAP